VAVDDLSAPLGQNARKSKRRLRLPVAVPHVVAGALGLFVTAWTGWALLANDPFGGEPWAVVATGPADSKTDRAMAAVASQVEYGPRSYDGPGSPSHTPAPASQPAPAAPAPGTKTVTIIDGSTGKRQEVAIPATRDARTPAEQRLFENTRHGAVPRIAPDGARPAETYAHAVRPRPDQKNAPRVAIVFGGLGISAQTTQQAIEKLPASVTLAFQPYGADVARTASAARVDGHEILLQVPMEPFDYPDNDSGPQTLLTSLGVDQNTDRLHWLMSRFQGYVGIANHMGARFTASEQALAPVLKETAKRGLIYFDDGSSTRSLAGQIANANKLPFAKSEVALDAVPTPAGIDRALSRLEAMAREHGIAVGYASALPASIERVARWTRAAESRGILLVPISAVAIKPKSS
jgi:polysaccharide deacetylase 2 family uncharacterized protein YibQ